MLSKIIRKMKKIFDTIYIKILLTQQKGVHIDGNVSFNSIPIIKTRGGNIIIGNNVTLNSNNKDYFINMYSPIKLCTGSPKAIIKIGENSRIHGTCIHAYEEILIGENCLIAANCQIVDTNRHELSFHNPSLRLNVSTKTKPVHIEDNVWIGANCIILPGVTIGEGSVIAAGSIVNKSVPPFSLYGGNPARKIKTYPIPNIDCKPAFK